MDIENLSRVVRVSRLDSARLAEVAANLTPKEAHAVTDLTLYAVNTGALYRGKVLPTIARQAALTARGLRLTLGPWLSIALEARHLYIAELKADPLAAVATFRQGSIMAMVAASIKENYQEDIEEQNARA
jgi:hypothetical protein